MIKIIGTGDHILVGEAPFTPRAKRVLELAMDEARQLGHNYVGTEHILLGLIREGEGVAAQVLKNLGADMETARKQVIRLLGGNVPAGFPSKMGGSQAKTQTLNQFGRDLTELAKIGKVDPVIGREKEIERVIRFFPAGPRTTRYSSVNRGWARRRLWKVWPNRSKPGRPRSTAEQEGSYSRSRVHGGRFQVPGEFEERMKRVLTRSPQRRYNLVH